MMEATIRMDGQTHTVTLQEKDGEWTAAVDGETFPVRGNRRGLTSIVDVAGELFAFDTSDAHSVRIDGQSIPYQILALSGVAGAPDPSAGVFGPIHPPMIGKLDSILVEAGATVAKGDVLFVLEAMKMRNEIKAPADGVVGKVLAKAGASVDTGTVILVLEPAV